MDGTFRVDFPMAQTLAAAHDIALKRYSSAGGRRDLRMEALVSSDESEASYVGSNARSDADSDAGSDAGSLVA